ncbi:DUF2510 domain-containing protein [Rhodococcus triatomae]
MESEPERASSPASEPPASPPPPAVPAGWYPDPDTALLQRYWDGTSWTERTAPLP